MTETYQSGSIDINTLILFSSRGTLDLSKSLVSVSIYESIFTPGTICDLKVIDTKDQLGEMRLAGDETLLFEYSIPGTVTASFLFAIHELSDLGTLGSQKAKQYTLKGVSEEAMHSKTNYIQKSYDTLCSDMVEDIFRNYMMSNKQFVKEPTRGSQKIIIPHKNPYQAVNLIKQRAVSSKNQSPVYTFFENRQDEEQTFNFVTIESLFQLPVIKNFIYSYSPNIDIFRRVDDNILAFKIPNQFSSIEKIEMSAPTKVTTFNFTTWDFDSRIVQTPESNYKDGGTGSTISNEFQNKYFKAKIPPQALLPVDISQRPTTYIPETIADVGAYISQLAQNSVKIRVPGDTILTAGTMIDCFIPRQTGLTGPTQQDPLMSGKFLITRIHHKIGEFAEKPRYTCVIECIKGRYNESIV